MLNDAEKNLLEAAREMGLKPGVIGCSEDSVVALILACQVSALGGVLPDIVDMRKRVAYKERIGAMEARIMELIGS
jgi:hypothetical protein